MKNSVPRAKFRLVENRHNIIRAIFFPSSEYCKNVCIAINNVRLFIPVDEFSQFSIYFFNIVKLKLEINNGLNIVREII